MTEFERLALLFGCKATLILGIVAALSLLAGRRWPHACATWMRFGVIALLVLPAGVWALPTISVPVLPARHSATSAGETSFLAPGGASLRAVVDDTTVDSKFSGYPQDVLPAGDSVESAWFGWSALSAWGLCLTVAYGLVVTLLAIRFVTAWMGLDKLRRASALVEDPVWQDTLADWSKVLQVFRRVDLRSSEDVSVPMTFGWRVPVILVPADCVVSCDRPQREAIMIHELAHIAQGDFFWQAITQLTAILYWMHPLVWLIRREDGTLRERICDALCSQYLSRESYAQSLVKIAGRRILSPAAAFGIAMAHPSSLRRRLIDLQSDVPALTRRPSRVRRTLLGGTAGLVLGLIVVGTLATRASNVAADDVAPPAPGKPAPPAASSKVPAAQKSPEKDAAAIPIRLPSKVQGDVVDQAGKPVANAHVTIRIERMKPDGYPSGTAAPKPWIVVTDEQGHFQFSTDEPTLSVYDMLHIKIRADGFVELSEYEAGQKVVEGSLPVQRLYATRKIQGRIIDHNGKPVTEAVVRFQANSEMLPSRRPMLFDSGPLPVDKRGAFSIAIPQAGKAAFAIYPRGFAPQIVDVPDGVDADLGLIRVDTGTSLTGRAVDKRGHGIAGTVVSLKSTETREVHSYRIQISIAVKTDDQGKFTLPPVRGSYTISVSDSAPDYSQRLVVTGAKAPPIQPQKIDFDGIANTRGILLREAGSVTVRGTVRWADGSPVPNVEVRSYMMPDGWKAADDLASTRTDAMGRCVLWLPAPVESASVWIPQSIRAPDGYRQVKAVGPHSDVGRQHRSFKYDHLSQDINDADFVVDSKE